MIKPTAFGEILKYSLQGDKVSPTIWLLAPMDSITKSKILGEALNYDMSDPKNPKITANLKPFDQDILVVKLCLKGFENFSYDKGKREGQAVPFKTEKKNCFGGEKIIVSDETIKDIPREVIHTLADVAWSESEVTEEEEKN
jgi:hypothetical protein